MPTGTEDLAKNNSQISYPSPLSGPIPTPTVRRSHSYSSGSSSSKAQLRSRSMGVRFLSPAKSKSPENLEVDNSNDQDCYQLKNLDDARQDTVWGVDNSDNSRDKVRPDAPFSEANSVQFVDLTNSAVERQSESIPSVSENPLQSSSSAILSFDLPSLARVEPASSSTLPLTQQQSGKTNDSASSSSGSMFVQTKLDAFTRPIGSTSIQNTNASATVQPRYFTEKTRSPAVSLSLEEPVTCARVVPLEALKLERNKKCNNEPRIMERGGCQKTADSEDTEGRSEITRAADLVEKPAAMIPAVSSVSYQDSVSQCHAQPHACESIEDITDESRAHYDDELETDSDVQYTDSPSTCARLMPVEFVKFKRSGQDDRVAVESDTSPSPSQLESKDTRDLNLPETNATNVKVIDLTLLVDSQSPSPKSPESNTHPSGFQGLNSGFQSPKHSIALIAAEGSSDHHYSAQGSSPNSANSANILTPLPKVGSPNVTDALYGKEPSQRSQNSRSSSGTKRKQLLPQPLTFLHDPFNTPSSSLTSISAGNKFSFGDLPQAPASKRPKLSTDNGGDETELQTTTSATAAAKSRRVLPAFLQPGSTREQEKFNNCSKSYDSHSCGGYSRGQVEAGVGVCVCGRGETQRVPMCRQCRASIIKLNRSGLFGRLSKLDLSSPEICQVRSH